MNQPLPSLYAGVLAACLTSACFNPVEASNAYDGEIDLCAPEQTAEYTRRIADCRARWLQDRRSCAGVISFSGKLQGVDIVVDAELASSEVRNFLVSGLTRRDRLKMQGPSPYFIFELTLKLLGGSNDETGTRTLNINPAVAQQTSWHSDDRADVELGLFAGTSGEVQLSTGQLVLEQQTADENSGRFEGSNRNDTLRGCYHAFTTAMTLQLGEP